jgi:hypothetical protein
MTSTNKKYNIKTGSISPLDFTLAEGGGAGEGRAVASKLYYSPKTNGEFTGSNAYLADFSINETLLPNYVYELAVEFVGPRIWTSNGNIPLVFGPDIENATISNSNIIPVRNNVDAGLSTNLNLLLNLKGYLAASTLFLTGIIFELEIVAFSISGPNTSGMFPLDVHILGPTNSTANSYT